MFGLPAPLLLALIVAVPPQTANEVLFLDLTGVVPRIQLRRPPPPPPKCKASGCLGRTMSMGIGDCGGSGPTEPRAMRVTLLRLDQESARRGDRVGYELLVKNVVTVPMSIPTSPHLADFHPPDPGEKFTVEEIDQ